MGTREDFARYDREFAKIVSESRRTKKSILESLLANIQAYSNESREHGERMAGLARKIGERLGYTEIQRRDLVLLACVHDVGKILVPGRILEKAGPLTDEEWVEMKKHTLYGYKIALATPDIRHVAEGLLFHHERWDGQGYPHGLSGQAIPLNARILAVVDAFDVMSHDRPYAKALSNDEAIQEMRNNAGKQFDPAIVDLLMMVL
jgi:HD-GYP domain-containing protein (c-di-GMP phosphodiesterase class II)